MNEKNIKKILLPLCFMALCFIMIKTPVVPVNVSENTPLITPFSNMEDADDTADD